MLKPYKITDYINEFQPQWACPMPDGCPPKDVLTAHEHPFFRLAKQADTYSARDFMTYAELYPQRNWGAMLPLAVGLSLIEGEAKLRRSLKLPMFRQFRGVIALTLSPGDGVVKQTGAHRSHYTWWRTTAFQLSNLKMLSL